MKPLSLRPHEVRRLASAGEVMVVRVVKPQPGKYWTPSDLPPEELIKLSPFGSPGTRMWARERWAPLPGAPAREGDAVLYDAKDGGEWLYSSANSMPRWASRFSIETVSVQCKRVQEAIPADAISMGCPLRYSGFAPEDAPDWMGWISGVLCVQRVKCAGVINRQAWLSNPWCWFGLVRRVEE